jgi:hypothetical protein
MSILKMLVLVILFVLLTPHAIQAQTASPAPASTQVQYDAVKDFSITANPNGVWTYGWTSSLGSPLTPYAVTDTSSFPGTSFWFVVGNGGNGITPCVAHNDTGVRICASDWCLPPNDLLLHPGPNGEYSVVRWTAPSSETIVIHGIFEGLVPLVPDGPTSTDVHVLHNSSRSLLRGPINSYRQPLAFGGILLRVAAGDTIDFAVGFGSDGNYNADSTGIRFVITRLWP